MKLILSTTLAAFAAIAATAPDVKPPSISADTRARFWRAYAEQTASAAAAQRAQDTMKTVEAELRAACGEATLAMDEKGEPTCRAKELPPKPDPKK